ncbi:acyl carrier protein [[Kitasatospora] papulosa]|uniref:acyl carrier protein n=1 Tax=[Kitasatospora] papulosa TaxID=1464011 RepID=UPI002E3300E8|nr:acyl carrier protein [[Kitasatospora] papulosa]
MNIKSRLEKIWAAHLECEDDFQSSDFFDCGGTSVTAVHLAADIQEEFGVEIDALEVVTHGDFLLLVNLIAERVAADSEGGH